ncbi:hypothetical protein ACNFJ7_12910 [Sphingomonas sp. HT-1]|uniref:hypothetical protein n=1 Tax=unclassified Sphingomonas TaxID=196159 RepID=UPI000A6EF9F0|nr:MULTISPECIES: hypothetical protein [unclassified Sphingomonas]
MKTRLLLCGVLILPSGCGRDSLCSSETLHVARDPGSNRIAVTSVRNCGATSDYATVVSIRRASDSPSAAIDVFVADSDHGAAADAGGGAVWTSVAWVAPGKLSVARASKARVFKQLSSAKGANITYKASDPLSAPAVD